MSELLRCANCLAPVRLDVGPVVTCSYCRAQTRVDAPTVVAKPPAVSGRRLAETIAFVTPSMKKIPFLAKGAAVPIFQTETLSTSHDNQETLQVNLVQGERPLASFPFPIHQRAPRGVPKIALTVRVAESGAMSVTLAEPGTDNVLDRDGIDVIVAS